jgi:hypothetical protein
MRQQRRPAGFSCYEQVGVVEEAERREQDQGDKCRAREAFHENPV